jgi:putative ABC transport system permease protein
MRSVAFTLRDALRCVRHDRGYTVTIVFTLALTIGATTAVFSIVNGVLLAPLAYDGSDQLVALRELWREVGNSPSPVNDRHANYWREHARSFDSMAQYIVRPANLTGRGDAAQVNIARANATLFAVLRARAAIGRTLMLADELEGAPDVIALTDSSWRRRFGADPGIVGQVLVLDGKPYTVVGVLPASFALPEQRQNEPVDGFIPLRPTAGWMGDHNNQAIGRLRPGVALEQARAELDVLQTQISAIVAKDFHEAYTLRSAVIPLTEYIVGRARRGLLLLLAAIGAVLLIACSNLANLSLTRTLGRLREAAIRSALGASRRQLIAKALIEQLMLALLGGALGLWVASLALRLFIRTAPVDLPRVGDVTLDVRVLAFTAAVSILAGLLVAFVPAWRLARSDMQATLRALTGAVAGDRRSLRSQGTLLALQVALSVTLLVVTALLGASLVRVLTIERGFTIDRVLAVDLSLPATRYATERVRQPVYDRLLAAVHALPGVSAVSTTSVLPLRGSTGTNSIAPEGKTWTISEMPIANFRFVAPDYFRTLGLAVKRGRPFTDAERDAKRPAPVLISESISVRVWPGEDPIGKRFSRGVPNEQGFEVVGIVGDARMASLDEPPPLMVYVPYWWRSRPTLAMLIKTEVEPTSVLADVRRAVREVDPDIAVGDARPLEQIVNASTASRRYQTRLFVAFGLAALFIAAVGVYSVTSDGVSRRRREMNIRVALGAQTRQVVHLILRQATAPVIVGLIAGIAGALSVGGVVTSLLFEVRARDPFIVIAVVGVVGCVGFATCLLAARQGLAIDPARALREE